MNRYHILLALLGLFLWSSCKERDMLVYLDENAPAPQQVTEVMATSTPGGAKLTYKLPSDKNLLYVKAVYDIRPGFSREAKTTLYNDTLVVDGFGDTSPREVKLYSVGRNGKASEPVTVNITPLTPPVKTVFASLELKETFGGASVVFKNPDEASMAIVLMRDSTGNGDWEEATTYYTEAAAGSFAARGYDTVLTKFAVYTRDRWNNKSDTLTLTLKPIFETQLERAPIKQVTLPSDTYTGHTFSSTIHPISMAFDGIINNSNNCFHTRPSEPKMPQWFTFDLGAESLLSRFKFYHRAGTSGFYRGGDPKRFEIWGSNNPNVDGSWDSWILLGSFTSVKPSGRPVGDNTKEDEDFAVKEGEDFDFPPGTPSVRYLRWKTVETWGNFQYMYIAELTFWGARK